MGQVADQCGQPARGQNAAIEVDQINPVEALQVGLDGVPVLFEQVEERR